MKKFLWILLTFLVVMALIYLDCRYVVPFYWSPEIRYTDAAYSIIVAFALQCLLVYWVVEETVKRFDE